MSHNRPPVTELMPIAPPETKISPRISLFSPSGTASKTSQKERPISASRVTPPRVLSDTISSEEKNRLALPDAVAIHISQFLPLGDFCRYYRVSHHSKNVKPFAISTYPISSVNNQLPRMLLAVWTPPTEPTLRQQAYHIIGLASQIDAIILTHHREVCSPDLSFNIPAKWLPQVATWSRIPPDSKIDTDFVKIELCVRGRLDDIKVKLNPIWGKIINYGVYPAGMHLPISIAASIAQEYGPALSPMRQLKSALDEFSPHFQQIKSKVSHLYHFFNSKPRLLTPPVVAESEAFSDQAERKTFKKI